MSAQGENTPAAIIGLDGELTLENIHQSYRRTREQMLSTGQYSELDLEEVDWAYRALLYEFEQHSAEDSEDSVVSAASAESDGRVDFAIRSG